MRVSACYLKAQGEVVKAEQMGKATRTFAIPHGAYIY